MTVDEGGRPQQRILGAVELAARIEGEIVDGERRPGDRLPPVRSLARSLSLAPNTVSAAYRILARRGLAEGRGRAGTFVTGHSLPSRFVAEAPTDGLVDMANGNPDPSLLPDLSAALGRLVDGERVGSVVYGAPMLAPGLHAAIDHFWASGARGEEFLAVPGAMAGVGMALATNLRPGDAVAIEDPGYGPVRSVATAGGLKVIPVAVDDEGMRPESLSAALRSRVRALVATPRAQNPTGAALTPERAATLAEIVAHHPDVLVIDDDHAGPIAGVEFNAVTNLRAESGDAGRWLLIRSVAKALGPDLRLAVATGDPTTIGRMAQNLANTSGWVSHLLQELVAELLADAEVSATVERATAAYRERRRGLVDALVAGGVGDRIQQPRSGFNCWVAVDDEASVVGAMAREGFAVTPGARFRLASPPGIRISVGAHELATVTAAGETLARILTRGRVGRLG